MNQETIDRLAITIVDGSQSRDLIKVLNEAGFSATIVDAVGGFLHEALVTLLVGFPQSHLSQFYNIVREQCPRRTRYVPMGVELSLTPGYPMMIEASVGGATVILLPVEQFVQL